MNQQIFFCGDPHDRFDHIIRAVKEHRPAAIVLLGDNFSIRDASQTLEEVLKPILDLTEVWTIHGNHETDHEATTTLMQAYGERNLHGRVVEIAAYRIAGLGGVFREKIWASGHVPVYPNYEAYLAASELKRPPRLKGVEQYGEDRKHLSSIFVDDYNQLASLDADILVTHEAPSCHPYGFPEIDELAQAMGVSRTFHGHQHDSLDYSAHHERLGFIPRGVGLRGIIDQDGQVIVAGEADELRTGRT